MQPIVKWRCLRERRRRNSRAKVMIHQLNSCKLFVPNNSALNSDVKSVPMLRYPVRRLASEPVATVEL
jgi:hypothetical protein